MDIPILQRGREEWRTLFEKVEDLLSDYVRAFEIETAFGLKGWEWCDRRGIELFLQGCRVRQGILQMRW